LDQLFDIVDHGIWPRIAAVLDHPVSLVFLHRQHSSLAVEVFPGGGRRGRIGDWPFAAAPYDYSPRHLVISWRGREAIGAIFIA